MEFMHTGLTLARDSSNRRGVHGRPRISRYRHVNLGLDELVVFHFNAGNGGLSPIEPFVKVNPGAGPRHLAFHPNGKFGYLLTEMENAVTVFSYKAQNGSLSALQTISTLRREYSGPKEAAELVVHPSGKFLYASNRAGVDSITAFAIDRV